MLSAWLNDDDKGWCAINTTHNRALDVFYLFILLVSGFEMYL